MDALRSSRVRRRASEWRKLLSRFDRSGLSARAFCSRESINLATFQRWRKKFASTAPEEALKSDRFVEVASSEGFPAFWSIEFELPDGRILRVRG